ncbi:MAG: hypothetical protein NTV46_08745, partial [Verrucomicrobia bacterium]|nr:hypothetical protein [Verrucomicrobiota bacterium]
MKTAVKSPESADCRCEPGIFLTETPSTEAPEHFFRPLFPRNPHDTSSKVTHQSAAGRSSTAPQSPPIVNNFAGTSEVPLDNFPTPVS